MAHMQADLDRLLKPRHTVTPSSRLPHQPKGPDGDGNRSGVSHDTPAPRSRRS
jgi:hypothetical protein